MKYIIEDQSHAEYHGEYNTFEEALNELKNRQNIPWDKEPNCCPCTSWRTCGRDYTICEFDGSSLILREEIFTIGSKGVDWTYKE